MMAPRGLCGGLGTEVWVFLWQLLAVSRQCDARETFLYCSPKMPSRYCTSFWVFVVTGLTGGVAGAAPATQYLLGKDAAITSIAGRSDTDIYLMRDNAIFHFDGQRAVKTKNQPLCLSAYIEPPSSYPTNVDNRDAEVRARSARSMRSKSSEDTPPWLVEFTTLHDDGSAIRLYGSGEQTAFRGSVHGVFSAKLTGESWYCEGWFGAEGATVMEVAYDGESAFVVSESYASHLLYVDPETYPFAALPGTIIGVSTSGIHSVWAWDRETPVAYHLNGFVWDVRPLTAWAAIARVQGAGPGRAWAIGSTTDSRDDAQTVIKSDSLAFWNGQAWVPVALPTGFTVQPRGLLVDSSERLLLIGEKGQYYRFEKGTFAAENGPAIEVHAVWKSPTKTWFLGGRCGEQDCLVKIGGRS